MMRHVGSTGQCDTMRRDARTQRDAPPAILQAPFYFICHCIFATILSLVFRARCHGGRNIPAHGPILLVANHQSYLDPPLVGMGIWQRQLHYVARQGLFGVRGLAWVIRWLNAIPIPEDGSSLTSMKEILRRLKAGHAVLIFPEGSRSRDGRMQPFKRGTSVLVERAGCPVVPVALEGAYDTWPRTAKRPKYFHGRIGVKYGQVITHADLMKDGADAGLDRLATIIESMRLELRDELRSRSRGRFPPPGPGDQATR